VTTANPDRVVTDADVRASQALLDALVTDGVLTDNGQRDGMSTFMHARRMVALWSADVRTAGYLEGVQAGKRQLGRIIDAALAGEGL
jgi:hypothetical protein